MYYYLVVFLVLSCLFLFGNTKWAKAVSIFGFIFTAAIWRFSSWQYTYSLCIDEAEWLSLAGRMQECNVPFRCFNGSTSGFLSIGFVGLLGMTGLDLSYMNLRVMGFLFCILPSVFFIYYGLRKWYGDWIANISFPWVVMFMIFGFYDREFLSYNTEYILLLFYSIIYYLYTSWKQNNFEHMREPLIISLLLGILPYFKLQSVPFVFAFYMLLLYDSWKRKKWLNMAIWHLAIVVPSLIIFIYFLSQNAFYDFYKMYIEANAYYVNHRITSYKYSNNEFIHRLRAFKGMHISTFLPLYIGLIPIVILNYKIIARKKNLSFSKTFIWIFIMVCYSTYTTGNGFGHYNILLIVPYCYLLGNLYCNISAEQINLNKWLTLAGVTITSIIFLNRVEVYPLQPPVSNVETEKHIVAKSAGNEPVLFLGYVEALEAQIRTGLKLPVRNATSHFIAIKDSSLRRYFQDGFFQDMNNSRPQYVVDMEDVLEMPGLQPVKNYIHSHYAVDTLIEGNVIYAIKN